MGASSEIAIRFEAGLRRFFRRRVLAADVDDLVQEVLLRMHARQSDEPIANVEGYVFTVAKNVLRKRAASAGGPVAEEMVFDTIDTLTPERHIFGRHDVDLVIEAIGMLPDRTQQIFLAHRFDELTYAVIAQQHGISTSAVEKHIMSALRSLAAATGRHQ